MRTEALQSMHANSGSAEYACEQRLCRVCMLTVPTLTLDLQDERSE
jgi:hypothetical protein